MAHIVLVLINVIAAGQVVHSEQTALGATFVVILVQTLALNGILLTIVLLVQFAAVRMATAPASEPFLLYFLFH